MKISVYSIVKNEEAEIEAMIESAMGADEHIIVDTGSTDKTIELIKKYPHVKLFTDYTWNDDFSEAKNHAASKCTGDWLVSLDADCRLSGEFLEQTRIMIENTTKDVLFVRLQSIQFPTNWHKRGKIYRNNGKIFYEGMAHEDLNAFGHDHESGVLPVIYYGYSINHKRDPDRYLRILTKQLDANPKSTRTLFYLAREYFYKKDYGTAINLFREYLKESKYEKERTEAWFHIAQAYWYSKQGGKAREACTQAVISNPDHKGVLNFMSEIHNEPWKSKWKHIANNATNKDVMFAK